MINFKKNMYKFID